MNRSYLMILVLAAALVPLVLGGAFALSTASASNAAANSFDCGCAICLCGPACVCGDACCLDCDCVDGCACCTEGCEADCCATASAACCAVTAAE